MKLFTFIHMARYIEIPDAWLTIGTRECCPFIRFSLPLFCLADKYDFMSDGYRFGWYVPTLGLIKDGNSIRWHYYWKFHSNFM